jgi:hypothetical protein
VLVGKTRNLGANGNKLVGQFFFNIISTHHTSVIHTLTYSEYELLTQYSESTLYDGGWPSRKILILVLVGQIQSLRPITAETILSISRQPFFFLVFELRLSIFDPEF